MKPEAGRALRTATLAFSALVAAQGIHEAAVCDGVSPVSNTTLKSVAVATGMAGRPLFVASPPGDLNRLFIVEQDGRIRIKHRGDPPSTVTTFLDISTIVQATRTLSEMGLLGLAFDPDYSSNGFFYVNYTEGPIGGPWFTVVARYEVSADPDVADPGSETRLLRFSQPQTNHNGGQLQFGPDGYLYISTGDGGSAHDTGGGHAVCGNGQSLDTLLGKILRVDVRNIAPPTAVPDCGGASAGYRIPAGNPFSNGPGGVCDEIWAYGLRNPWRSSFDSLTGDFYLADVGQDCWEEVNFVPSATAGQNYGWRMMEGKQCFNPATPSVCMPVAATCGTVPPCNDPSYTIPILDYGHTGGACSITGGYVYRGCLMPSFAGTYFYGDYCAEIVKALTVSGGAATNLRDFTMQLNPGGASISGLTSFGTDAQGEVYITSAGGSVLRIMPPFTSLEVSGQGAAAAFELGSAAWTWEDLAYTTMHPVASYRVYRGTPAGSFQCVFTSPTPQWPSGDPAAPAPGGLYAYLVTAVSAAEMTRTGSPTATLLPNACP